MRKLTMVFCSATVLWLAIPTALAQNTVDVLGGTQPTNTTGCAPSVSPPRNPNCIPATWSTTSNAGTDITSPITKNFVFDTNGGALLTDFPAATTGQICLADTRDLTGTTLFGQIAANCQAKGGVALLLIRDSAVNAPSAIPVFTVSTANGDFLKNGVTGVGFNPGTGVSNRQIRINVAVAVPPTNLTGQHNCPSSQAVPAYVGPGTANYTPNENLCLPVGAGQAVEPSMTVDSQGTIYVESIRGVPGGLDLWRWRRALDGIPNADGTLPFKYEGQPDCGTITTFCMTSGLAPGGGDGDVAVNSPDPSNGFVPNLAVVSLAAAEVTGSHSTNRADTFTTPNTAVAGVPFDDRMWLHALDDPKHVYMEYHDFGTTSQIFVQRSADGGQNYIDLAPPASTVVPPADAMTGGAVGPPTGNIAGQIKVDRSHTASHGNLYQIFVGPNNPTDNLNNSANYLNTVYVGVASPTLTTLETLSFTVHQIYTCGAGSTCPTTQGLGNLFPALAVDDFGNVYAAWSDGTDIYYKYSTDHGTTWQPTPLTSAIKVTQVSQPATQATKSNLFPWVAAEADGHVAIAWYGADKSGNSNNISANWNVFVAETVHGHAITPVFTLSQATDHVNHKGSISTQGFSPTATADRSLADFFQIAIDPTNHLINIVYADNSAGTSVTYFTRQRKATSGITGGCAGHAEDGEGDERGEKGGDAHFRFHHDDCNEQPDDEEFSDPGAGEDFHSTKETSVTRDDVAHSVTITGLGVSNGLPVAFTIVAVDSSLVPPGLFSIILSDGYTNSGNLLDGGITIH